MSPETPTTTVRTSRRKARQLALQALYAWKLSGNSPASIHAHVCTEYALEHVDHDYFAALLEHITTHTTHLDQLIAKYIRRSLAQLDPIEHTILRIATYELKHVPDIPYRVVINEAIELAKAFGGTDSHRLINSVTDKLSTDLRKTEVQHRQGQPKLRPKT